MLKLLVIFGASIFLFIVCCIVTTPVIEYKQSHRVGSIGHIIRAISLLVATISAAILIVKALW